LAAVLARLGQPSDAWQALEEDLGRGLLDELAARQDRRLAPEERARLRELTAQLERLDRLVESTPKGLDQAARAKRFEELKRKRALAGIALGEFQTKLAQAHGALAGKVATLNEIQSALPSDTALVAWVDMPPSGPSPADPDGEHWGVVVRSGGIPTWVPIEGTGPAGLWTGDDTELVGRVRAALRARPAASPPDLPRLLARLRSQRLEPLAKALATAGGSRPARRLIVLPSAVMAGIPVEALLAADDPRTVSYAPSATVYQYLREQPRPDTHAGLLALGDPDYGSHEEPSDPARLAAPVAVAEAPKLRDVLAAARSGDLKLARLPGTRLEVKSLARSFQAADRSTHILLGAEASEPGLDRLAASGELGQYGFIHLATHGVIDEAFPERSAVILTQTGLPDQLEQVVQHKPVFDGRLSVREIQRGWDLKAELVTLSACETALGRQAGGEGFVGFTQALLMSGARSTCLSLWKVDDTATALLMQRFYGNLLGRRPGLSAPMPKAEALHEAKTWLRELRRPQVLAAAAELSAGVERGKGASARQSSDGGPTRPLLVQSEEGADHRPYAAPYFWAAFVLVGDPG
jgi:CHAT domain-containing protein